MGKIDTYIMNSGTKINSEGLNFRICRASEGSSLDSWEQAGYKPILRWNCCNIHREDAVLTESKAGHAFQAIIPNMAFSATLVLEIRISLRSANIVYYECATFLACITDPKCA